MRQDKVLEGIVSVKREITSAEEAIRVVLHELQISASGEEVSITQVVQDAFERLRSAKNSLAGLEKSLTIEPLPAAEPEAQAGARAEAVSPPDSPA